MSCFSKGWEPLDYISLINQNKISVFEQLLHWIFNDGVAVARSQHTGFMSSGAPFHNEEQIRPCCDVLLYLQFLQKVLERQGQFLCFCRVQKTFGFRIKVMNMRPKVQKFNFYFMILTFRCIQQLGTEDRLFQDEYWDPVRV